MSWKNAQRDDEKNEANLNYFVKSHCAIYVF